jgi:hypothetical protein
MQSSDLSRERMIAFRPDPVRGQVIYGEVKSRLAASLRHILAASSEVVEVDELRIRGRIDAIARAGRVSPAAFGVYYDLLRAIGADDVDAVAELFDELPSGQRASDTVAYRDLTDEDLGSANAARYMRWFDSDPESPLHLAPIGRPEFERIAGVTNTAFAILGKGAPDVCGEIRALLNEIVFAKGPDGAKTVFHGASSFFLWGAFLMNAKGHQTLLGVMETLAHESSHLHLFGVAVDGPLVLNPDNELYPSPLRFDPRPMDGLYHATYVSARMHYTLASLLESGVLDAEQRSHAETAMRDHVRNFRSGLATVESRGSLTDLGADLMAKAREYIAGC